MEKCFHCGDNCDAIKISYDQKPFCCTGCKTVYEIFANNNLINYYDIASNPGASPKENIGKFDFLDNKVIVEKLLTFSEQKTQIVNLYIPHIHCSSCIWVLENLKKINPAVISSEVNFPKKTVQISYTCTNYSLKKLVLMLSTIGYEPYISLEDYETKDNKSDKSLIYKLGFAGFAFGNIMFLSFPEYFEVDEYWLDQYKVVFRSLMFAFSLPVVFYAGASYFTTAYKGLKSKILNIDVPIALGIAVLFLRSTIDVLFDLGSGFFDSLAGLVFFLLLGKFFQQKTYNYLSFERDYKSYFPIAITRIGTNEKEDNIPIYDVKKGDRLLIRTEELIPVDGILISKQTHIDYSFVTGEAEPVIKKSGDKIYAGGKQLNGVMEMEALKSVAQSYLTQLWGNKAFSKDKDNLFENLTDRISKRFTVSILTIAFVATAFWLFIDASKALNVFTAVLIIACPCAIALSSPFTLGNLLHIFGKLKFYLKNASVIERLAEIDTIIFDKTGTITTATKSEVQYHGVTLTPAEELLLKNTLRGSNHPLSRTLYDLLSEHDIVTLDEYEEHTGKGILGTYKNDKIKIGSAGFVGKPERGVSEKTSVHVSMADTYKGEFVFKNQYRAGLKQQITSLEKEYKIIILSGDNEGERKYLQGVFPKSVQLHFKQKPEDKLNYICKLQEAGCKVLMVGDGLNDAGALAQSNVGIAISENVNVFSPACDAILDADQFKKIFSFLKASKTGIKIIKWSFLLSLVYNLVGLSFAVTGNLMPVVAAILMPLSSVSIVVFTTVATSIVGKRIK